MIYNKKNPEKKNLEEIRIIEIFLYKSNREI